MLKNKLISKNLKNLDMKLKKDIIIAIDGYASCGKSTLAKDLARTLNYVYIDTGAMYRAVTLYALRNGIINDKGLDKDMLIGLLPQIKIEFVYNSKTGRSETFLNGENVEKQIRGIQVSQWVSQIAEIKQVREYLVRQQQELGKNKRIVMDGRDIGTVVFPNAEIKLFLTASVEERAKRRYLELKAKGYDVDYQEILNNVKERDKIDSSRAVSPLRPAKDAIIIDNTNIGIEEQFAMVISLLAVRYGNGIDVLLAD